MRWTPRLVLLDLSGSLGGVGLGSPGEGAAQLAAAAGAPSVATWHGASRLVRREAVPKSAFVRALEAEADAAPPDDADARQRSDSDDDDDERTTRRRRRAPPPAPPPEPVAAPDNGGHGEGESEVERAGAALEGAVSFWTDYAKALLHPRSALLLPGAWHGVTAFDGYGDSAEHGTGPTADEAHDRIRYDLDATHADCSISSHI